MSLRVLVCGGRDYRNTQAVFARLDQLHAETGIATIIHGAARGADTAAGQWAAANNVDVLEFPADWDTLGRFAGPVRNRRMLEQGRPDCVIAFPGKEGTANMVDQAKQRGVRVEQVP